MCDIVSRVGAGGEGSQGVGIEHVLIKAQRQQNKLFSRQAVTWSLLTNLCCYLLFLKIIGLRLKLIKLSAHLFPSCLPFINNKAEVLNFILWYEEKKERICLSTGDTSTALHHRPTTPNFAAEETYSTNYHLNCHHVTENGTYHCFPKFICVRWRE